MKSPLEEQKELIALTKLYLLQEYRPHQRLVIVEEASKLFALAAAPQEKAKKKHMPSSHPTPASTSTTSALVDVPISLTAHRGTSPATPDSSAVDSIGAILSPPIAASKLSHLTKSIAEKPLLTQVSCEASVQQAAPQLTSLNKGEKNSTISPNAKVRFSPSSSMAPSLMPPKLEDIRVAIQKKLPAFVWQPIPTFFPEPSTTTEVIILSQEGNHSGKVFFTHVAEAIHHCGISSVHIDLGQLAPAQYPWLFEKMASLPLRFIAASPQALLALPQALPPTPLHSIGSAEEYLRHPLTKRNLWEQLCTWLSTGDMP